MRLLMIIACLYCFDAFATECSLPLPNQDQTEQVWPYLANISVSAVFDEPVTLRAGQFSGAPFVPDGHSRPELLLWPELLLSADLDGEAGDEKIGLLSETSGGSGERVYLIVAVDEDGQFRALPAALLGDRVKVRSMEVRERQIILRIIEAGPNQPMCCGTQLSRLNWQIEDGQLVLKERLVEGELSLDAIQGQDWYLLDRPGDRLNAMHPSCTQLNIQGNRFNMKVNGQTYNGIIDETLPGHIVISDVMPEVRAADTPDTRLASDLIAVSQYTFRAGRLLFSGKTKERPVNFEFAASP